jgi:hypothetical protein
VFSVLNILKQCVFVYIHTHIYIYIYIYIYISRKYKLPFQLEEIEILQYN